MTGIEDLRERVLQAEQRFGVLDEQDANYSERLIALMNAIEGRFREQQSEIEQQAEEIGRQGKELAGLSGRLNRTAEENEQLRGMLLSLLTAIEGGRHDSLAETMRELDCTVSALLQGSPQEAESRESPSGPVEESAEAAQAEDGAEAAEPNLSESETESAPVEAVGLEWDEAFDTGAADELGATDEIDATGEMGGADDTVEAPDADGPDADPTDDGLDEIAPTDGAPVQEAGVDAVTSGAVDDDTGTAVEGAAPAAPLFMGPEDVEDAEDAEDAETVLVMDDEPNVAAPGDAAAEIGAAVAEQDVTAAVEIDETDVTADADEAGEAAETADADGDPIFAQGSAAEPSVADETDVAETATGETIADETVAEPSVADETVVDETATEKTATGADPGPDAAQPCTLDEIMRRVSRLVEEADAAGLPASEGAEGTASEGAEGAVPEGAEGAASEAEETLGRTATGS